MFPPSQKEVVVLRVMLVALVVFASIYAFVDCVQTDHRVVRTMPKPVWLIAVLVPVLGPIGWLVAGRAGARGGGAAPRGPGRRPSGPRGPRGPRGPLGPDDDPDFLRKL